MFRILFDENVPDPLRAALGAHAVRTADEEGWGALANGLLISRAEAAGFQIFMTCDQSIAYQQNLSGRAISMVVLGSNTWPYSQPIIDQILEAVSNAVPGSFEFIQIRPRPKVRPS